MKRLNIYLPEETYEALRKESFLKKQSMSQIIGALLDRPKFIIKNVSQEIDPSTLKPGQIIPTASVEQVTSIPPKLPKPKKKEKIVKKEIVKEFVGLTRGELDAENYV